MVKLMQGYPNSLPESTRGEGNLAYYQAYKYPILALREGLLRYPDAPQADQWRWDLAYDLALTGDVEAGKVYANLLAKYLNRGDVDLDYLYAWLPIVEPEMTLYLAEIEPPTGYLSAHIVELRCRGGSAFIWLLEATGGYQAIPLLTHFDFENSLEANWMVADLDRNPGNGDELAVYFSNLPGQTLLDSPRVYKLNKIPVVEMPFLPGEAIFNVGMDFTNYWSVSTDHSGKNDLLFKSTIYTACPALVRRYYRWNGLYFSNHQNQYEFMDTPLSPGECESLVNHAANTWGPSAAISLMEALLPDWPPPQDPKGDPYPVDEKDEWRYRLGVYNAMVGDWETGIRYLSEILTDPTVYNSRWIALSQELLAIYQKPGDIYKACVSTEFCDPAYALEYLVGTLHSEADVLQFLWKSGVKTNSSGWFDFDGDEETERWFTVRHRPRETLEFWILARYLGGIKALRVSPTNAIQPTLDYIEETYIADEGLALQPVVMLDGKVAFSMRRLPDDQEPYLVDVPLRKEYPSRFFVPLESYQAALLPEYGLESASPEIIQQKLLDLEEYPGLLCKTNWTCDLYYYLLGLASELAGDELASVEAYHRLWVDYTRSPYTIMARLKLVGLAAIVSPTSTSSSTPTYTGTPVTPSPTTTSASPTTTRTNTSTPTTSSPTFTNTGTPPTSTSTPEPTDTEVPQVPTFTLVSTTPVPYIPPTVPTVNPYVPP
jgi:hypothetical protein